MTLDIPTCPDDAHDWVWFDGRPGFCRACGAAGHPLAYTAAIRVTTERVIDELIEMLTRERD